MKNKYYNQIDWTFIENAFKINKDDIPDDFYQIMSNCSYFDLYDDDMKITIGNESSYELIQDSFYYNILPCTIIKIGHVSKYEDLIYSNHSGDFHIYYVKNNSCFIEDFHYLCDSFDELINEKKIIKKILTLHRPLNDKVFQIDMIKKYNYGFNQSDFNILCNMIKNNYLPKDLVEIFSYSSCFYVELKNNRYKRILTFGEESGVKMYDTLNYLAVMGRSHNIVIGIDGYGNSIVYSDKSGYYKIYIASDSNFIETEYTYLADNLYDLLIDKKNIDILLKY